MLDELLKFTYNILPINYNYESN